MKVDLAFVRFPFKRAEDPDVTDWMLQTQAKTMRDPRVDRVYITKFDDTPITMTRNLAIEFAKARNVDYLLMVDSDMGPDEPNPGAKPFWDTSFDFVLRHRHKPCVVGAPYVGPPPVHNIYVFRWRNHMNGALNHDFRLDQFTRDEAERLTGITEVAALPTGLILIDMRAIDYLKPPYFYYEWADETKSRKVSTEDVTFTRDLSVAGIPLFCNWDAWAKHYKYYGGGKPRCLDVQQMRDKFSDELVKSIVAEKKGSTGLGN